MRARARRRASERFKKTRPFCLFFLSRISTPRRERKCRRRKCRHARPCARTFEEEAAPQGRSCAIYIILYYRRCKAQNATPPMRRRQQRQNTPPPPRYFMICHDAADAAAAAASHAHYAIDAVFAARCFIIIIGAIYGAASRFIHIHTPPIRRHAI